MQTISILFPDPAARDLWMVTRPAGFWESWDYTRNRTTRKGSPLTLTRRALPVKVAR